MRSPARPGGSRLEGQAPRANLAVALRGLAWQSLKNLRVFWRCVRLLGLKEPFREPLELDPPAVLPSERGRFPCPIATKSSAKVIERGVDLAAN